MSQRQAKAIFLVFPPSKTGSFEGADTKKVIFVCLLSIGSFIFSAVCNVVIANITINNAPYTERKKE